MVASSPPSEDFGMPLNKGRSNKAINANIKKLAHEYEAKE
jgi:hypothetical protein